MYSQLRPNHANVYADRGRSYRQLINYIETEINIIGSDLPSKLPFEPGLAIETC